MIAEKELPITPDVGALPSELLDAIYNSSRTLHT